ncbi:MAG: hypothetical protein AB7N76_10015 [Planctomycetota bacterium]
MSDRRLRELERELGAGGAEEQAAWLHALARAGLDPPRVERPVPFPWREVPSWGCCALPILVSLFLILRCSSPLLALVVSGPLGVVGPSLLLCMVVGSDLRPWAVTRGARQTRRPG